jgi:thiol-disulfide isomerase/thioredoxin
VAERLTKRQRQEEIRAKAAARRAEQARKEKMRRIYTALGAVLSVVVVIAALVIVKVTTGNDKKTPAVASGLASDAVLNALGNVTGSTYDTVGAGSIQALPKAITDAPALTADGKPKVLYVGAEFCPFCAAERWAVVAALSRFGSFQNLGVTSSSGSDSYPNTQSLSFHGATYSSTALSFAGYETTDRDRKALDKIPADDQAIATKYDAPPYVAKDSAGSIPFVDIGGKWMISGASFDPDVLKGKTHEQIATAMGDPTSAIAKAVDGTANVITAALCTLTKNAPTAVCTSTGVKAATTKLLNAS